MLSMPRIVRPDPAPHSRSRSWFPPLDTTTHRSIKRNKELTKMSDCEISPSSRQERTCLRPSVPSTFTANSDGRDYFRRRPSAAQRRLEAGRRPALRRLGHEQSVCHRPRLRRGRVLVFSHHPRGLRADCGRCVTITSSSARISPTAAAFIPRHGNKAAFSRRPGRCC